MAHRNVVGSLLAVTVAFPIAACSGSSGSAVGGSLDETTAAAASDLSISQNTFAPGELTPSVGNGTAPGSDLTSILCHPELFARTVEYSEALNYHVNLFLQDVGALLQTTATSEGSTRTWVYDGRDADLQLVLDETSAGIFDVKLEMAAAGSDQFTTVVTGVLDWSNVNDITKQLTFDLDALHVVFPAASGDHSGGQLAVNIERLKNADGSDKKRVVTYGLTDFVPVYGDPHGPRTGTIDFVDEPGVGGAMLYDASTVFLCPPNPQGVASDATTYARWLVQAGMVSGRADAIASGGQMLSGDRWVGLSCRSNALSALSTSTFVTDDSYWLVKEEDGSGATLVGLQLAVQDAVSTDAPCNPAFGAVTDLNDDRNDPTIPSSLPSDAFPNQF
jgi:hypothetical protein